MQLYRLISGPDDAKFCERVERLLNLGWQLHGAPTLSFGGSGTRAGQAVTKKIDGDYAGFVHLNDLHPTP